MNKISLIGIDQDPPFRIFNAHALQVFPANLLGVQIHVGVKQLGEVGDADNAVQAVELASADHVHPIILHRRDGRGSGDG